MGWQGQRVGNNGRGHAARRARRGEVCRGRGRSNADVPTFASHWSSPALQPSREAPGTRYQSRWSRKGSSRAQAGARADPSVRPREERYYLQLRVTAGNPAGQRRSDFTTGFEGRSGCPC